MMREDFEDEWPDLEEDVELNFKDYPRILYCGKKRIYCNTNAPHCIECKCSINTCFSTKEVDKA